MMTQILFVQGGGAGVHDEWDNKLVDGLARALGRDYDIRYPRMPNEGDPAYAPWKAALEQAIPGLDHDALLVGHSIGGTILVTTLAETPERTFGGLFLVATPFVGAGGWAGDEMPPFPDLASRLPKAMPVYLYHGTQDETAPPAHVDLYARAIPHAHVRKLDGRNHQLNNDLAEVAADIRTLN
jgi:hypothetical protein